MTPKWIVRKKGRLQWESLPEKFYQYVLSLPDGFLELVIRKPESLRSLKMNAYYWGVPITLVKDKINEAYGKNYDIEQIHELMKELHGIKEMIGKTMTRKSTAKYSVQEFKDYWDRIIQWAAEVLELQIPYPNEVDI